MKTISFKTIFLNIFVIFAIIFTFAMPFLSTQNVFAEEQIKRYYYIVQNTYLIPDGQEIKGNIQLNASYYVQATGNPSVVINDIAYNYVIYNGITGKVPIASLSKKTIDNVSTPYFISSSKLTVNSDSEIWMISVRCEIWCAVCCIWVYWIRVWGVDYCWCAKIFLDKSYSAICVFRKNIVSFFWVGNKIKLAVVCQS